MELEHSGICVIGQLNMCINQMYLVASYHVIYTLKTESCYNTKFVVTGGTGGCRNDNTSDNKVGIVSNFRFQCMSLLNGAAWQGS